MQEKRLTQKEIGFIQGIMYAATQIKLNGVNARNLLRESGYPAQLFRIHASEDAEILKEELDRIEEEEKINVQNTLF